MGKGRSEFKTIDHEESGVRGGGGGGGGGARGGGGEGGC